ncbi:NAD(P)/FAD-dependent oxidoreductase [Nocardia vinacea]|uniref:NAD(P)/FAD-dependent oxidoreductase n=1 Tax=Nocardia vinacea TaxID=96468 RepID=UPI002E10554A|nr:NAD(P)/FAD-dependent oxidoreductase [Nocardia vinacea]
MTATASTRTVIATDVAIIGAGPAGLTAAKQLCDNHSRQVLVLDREVRAGGVPRHCAHPGYGIRDRHTFTSGPAYAERLAAEAESAGADILTEATVTMINDDRSLDVTTPRGLLRIAARAVIFATGARERARPARLVPGDRPAGVYTTGQLQQMVHLQHRRVGRRAVIVGAELVSWSAVLTLRHAGCRPVLMTSQYSSPESYGAFNLAGRSFLRVPVATRTRVVRVIGRGIVEGVEIEDLDTGDRRVIACDTVVFTGDWIPDHELARSAGIALDPATNGPLVDTGLRTSQSGVFAAGNVLHPVDTADIAALDGSFVADRVAEYLDGAPFPAHGDGALRILAAAPFRWAAPGLVRPTDPAPPRHRLLLWTDGFVRFPTVTLEQQGSIVAARRVPWPASPGRVFRVPWSIMDRIDLSRGPVTVGLAEASEVAVPGPRDSSGALTGRGGGR